MTLEAQHRAEADVDSFRRHLGPFVVAAETTRMAMVFTSAQPDPGAVIFANDSFLQLTGFTRDEALGRHFDALMSGDSKTARREMQGLFNGGSEETPNMHLYRRDGSDFWASIFVTPVHDAKGEIVQYFLSVVDLTERHKDHERAMVFIDELNHRVKNTLATVQSIVWQAFRRKPDPDDIRGTIEARLFALSRSHDLLSLSKWEGVGLHDLADAVLEPFGGVFADSGEDRIRTDGENIRLSPSTTLSLAIGVHELATNAAKYGSLSAEGGSVQFSWRIEQEQMCRRLALRWEEKGGPVVQPPSRQGFGSYAIERGIAHELGGEVQLDFHREGVICTIDIPAPADAHVQ